MRRNYLLAAILGTFLLLGLVFVARTQSGSRAEQLVKTMSRSFSTMGGYEATYMIEVDGQRMLGAFAVEGDKYRIEMADMEVYGDGAVRYEVDGRRREITLTTTEAESANILSNPANAFDLLTSLYEPTLLKEESGEALVSLRTERDPSSSIRLRLDLKRNLPTEITYYTDELAVVVKILSIKSLDAPLPQFDQAAYTDYETIDFR